MHVIAAKAVAFLEALDPPGFKAYQRAVVQNAQTLGETLATHDFPPLISGGHRQSFAAR